MFFCTKKVDYCLKIFGIFIVSVSINYIAACISQSVFVLNALGGAGANIPVRTWATTIWHDLYGLAVNGIFSFLLVITVGLLIALPSAAMIHRFLNLPKKILYPLAGATSMATILYIANGGLDLFYDLTMFAGSRGYMGFLCQLLAGALGGLTFEFLSRRHLSFSKTYLK